MNKKIFITRPFLPEIEEYKVMLDEIWDSKQLTNNGPFHRKFEKKLNENLGTKFISLVNNATTGLILTIKALGLKGEIITSPFSFIATAHSIKWSNLTPVFVDTDSKAGNIDPHKIESSINKNTCGILATHNYGIPGQIEKIQSIANKHNLPLIYDAAPSMGVKYKESSLLNYGDAAVVSFHATKVFTTTEGGAIITKSKKLKEKIDRLKNFYIVNEERVDGFGINGKMNEFSAALGLLQLKTLDKIISRRKVIFEKYRAIIDQMRNVKLVDLPINLKYNYAYVPIFFESGLAEREKFYQKMRQENIFCRRYWYPLITDHKMYNNKSRGSFKNARALSESVLCLPIHPNLSENEFDSIIKVLNSK